MPLLVQQLESAHWKHLEKQSEAVLSLQNILIIVVVTVQIC